jgi:hypothetical protein
VTPATELHLRALYLDDAERALRERGNAIRASSTAPWQATAITTGRNPNDLGREYFNAATATRRLAAELRALADMEEKISG